jgi:hypothetical protein
MSKHFRANDKIRKKGREVMRCLTIETIKTRAVQQLLEQISGAALIRINIANLERSVSTRISSYQSSEARRAEQDEEVIFVIVSLSCERVISAARGRKHAKDEDRERH